MAKLVPPGKLKRTYWVDAEGHKVKADAPGAVKKVWTNTNYYIRYRVNGKFKQTPAYRDKRSSEKKMEKLVQAAEQGLEGLVDPYKEHDQRKVVDHLEEFLPVLRQQTTNKKYQQETERILRAVLAACKVTVLGDLTADRLEVFFTGMKGSPNTRKKHHSAVSGFVKWLFQRKRIRENLILRIPIPRGGVKNPVRSLSVEEMRRLFEVAAVRPLQDAQRIRQGMQKGELNAIVRPEVAARLLQKGKRLFEFPDHILGEDGLAAGGRRQEGGSMRRVNRHVGACWTRFPPLTAGSHGGRGPPG
jgi:hypothetical protein